MFYRFFKISYCFDSKTSELNVKTYSGHCPKRSSMEEKAHIYFLAIISLPHRHKENQQRKSAHVVISCSVAHMTYLYTTSHLML